MYKPCYLTKRKSFICRQIKIPYLVMRNPTFGNSFAQPITLFGNWKLGIYGNLQQFNGSILDYNLSLVFLHVVNVFSTFNNRVRILWSVTNIYMYIS